MGGVEPVNMGGGGGPVNMEGGVGGVQPVNMDLSIWEEGWTSQYGRRVGPVNMGGGLDQ